MVFNFQAQKPRIEKLRRDRINGSLDEIKHLVLEALNKDVSSQKYLINLVFMYFVI